MSATLILTPSIQTVSPSTTQLVPPPVWQSVNVRAFAILAVSTRLGAWVDGRTESVGAAIIPTPMIPPNMSPVIA